MLPSITKQVFAARDDMRQAWMRMQSLFEAAAHPDTLFVRRVRRSSGSSASVSRSASGAGAVAGTAAGAAAIAAPATRGVSRTASGAGATSTADAATASAVVTGQPLLAVPQVPAPAAEDVQREACRSEPEENEPEAWQEQEQEAVADADSLEAVSAAEAQECREGNEGEAAAVEAVSSSDDPFAVLASSTPARSSQESEIQTSTAGQEQQQVPADASAVPVATAAPVAALVPAAPIAASRAELAAVVASHASMRGEIADLADQVRNIMAHE